jgi:regulator of cell morphogenesis and NO signaling
MMRTTTETADRTLGELVLDDARAARVFENFGLDFCCNGRRTLREAADAQNVQLESVVSALVALGAPAAEDVAPAEWDDLSVLTRHIVDRHHGYVRSASPALAGWLERLVQRHGERHPELEAMRQTFDELADEMSMHMMKEENILFPYINDLADARARRTRMPPSPFGTVLNPVRVMEADHALVGELMAKLRALSSEFVAPSDGCATYRLCFTELEAFERDLHRHIHLENNVLFPRAIELERNLA